MNGEDNGKSTITELRIPANSGGAGIVRPDINEWSYRFFIERAI